MSSRRVRRLFAWYASFGHLTVAQPSASEMVTRDPAWGRVRQEHLFLFPACEACGTLERREVHHLLPVSSHPQFELDPLNLFTLCRLHHFAFGHDPDGPGPRGPAWKWINVNCVRDVRMFRQLVR